MPTITWDENSPADGDGAGTAASALRGLKANLATGLAGAMYWPGSGGGSASSAGVPIPGSTRIFYGTESQVSALANGALMYASDTSRLWAVNSGDTVFLGGARVIESSVTTGLNTNARYVFVTGSGLINSSVQTYGLTFLSSPVVLCQVQGTTAGSPVLRDNPSTQTFLVDVFDPTSPSLATLAASTVTLSFTAYGPVSF